MKPGKIEVGRALAHQTGMPSYRVPLQAAYCAVFLGNRQGAYDLSRFRVWLLDRTEQAIILPRIDDSDHLLPANFRRVYR